MQDPCHDNIHLNPLGQMIIADVMYFRVVELISSRVKQHKAEKFV